MARTTPFWKQRQMWTIIVGLVALAFWVVGVGAGWRGWVLTPWDQGIVAHAQGFGVEAYIWWIPATVISLTAVVMAIGIAVVRHLVEGPSRGLLELEPVEALEPKEPFDSPGAVTASAPHTDTVVDEAGVDDAGVDDAPVDEDARVDDAPVDEDAAGEVVETTAVPSVEGDSGEGSTAEAGTERSD